MRSLPLVGDEVRNGVRSDANESSVLIVNFLIRTPRTKAAGVVRVFYGEHAHLAAGEEKLHEVNCKQKGTGRSISSWLERTLATHEMWNRPHRWTELHFKGYETNTGVFSSTVLIW